jgi:hypothetical protein
MSKMQRKAGFFLVVILGLAPYASFAQAPQQSQAANGQTSQDQMLKERASAYYHDLLSGDSAGAFALVAPESKNDFFKLRTDGLSDFRILDVRLADESATSATIKVQKTFKPAQFREPFDFETVETWKQIDGQWYVVLPNAKDMDSPFGRLAFNVAAAPGTNGGQTPPSAPPDLAAVQKKAETNAKNADPDQYLLALKKAMAQAQAQSAKDPKADSKDKKNTDQTTDPKPKQNN